MRSVSLLIVIAAGCAAHAPPPLVLNQHEAYEGKPGYLRKSALLAARTTGSDFSVGEAAQESQPPLTKMQRIDHLRSVLAAIDAHVAGLDEPPSHEQRLMLKMSVKELRGLLATWPDVLPEADEMSQVVDQMATTLPIEQPRLRTRMNQLADLIRVQVVLAGE